MRRLLFVAIGVRDQRRVEVVKESGFGFASAKSGFTFRGAYCAQVVAGCPSFGGQRTSRANAAATAGSGLKLCVVLHRPSPSRSVTSSRQSVLLAIESAASGLPNPAFQRTAFGVR